MGPRDGIKIMTAVIMRPRAMPQARLPDVALLRGDILVRAATGTTQP